jgi:23S rRNA A2030 N6-methylase RlmJ
MRKVFVSALFVLGFALSINAQNTPVLDKRQDNQKDRIKDGVKNGELTKNEAQKLRKEQKGIERTENRAKADGEVTATEQAKLDHKQDKASDHIAKQKHDAQDRNSPNTPAVDKRQDNQKDRIKDGVQSGELTKAEAEKLRNEQRSVKKAEVKAKSDGEVTPAERAKLDSKQDRASKHIAKQKHDKQDRN